MTAATPPVGYPTARGGGRQKRARAPLRALAIAGLLPVILSAAACGSTSPASAGAAAGFAAVPQAAATTASIDSCRPRPAGPATDVPRMVLPCLGSGPDTDVAAAQGRPQVINLWASWCVPCQKELPMLQAVHRVADKRVAFVGINTADTRDSALDFLAAVQVTFPQLFDGQGRYRAALHVPGIPVTLVVDTEGRIVKWRTGPISQADLLDALADAGVDLRDSMPGGQPG